MPGAVIQPIDLSNWWGSFRTQITRYLLLLQKRWWVVFLTASLGLGAAACYVYSLPPSYLSAARMMVSGRFNLQEGAAYTEEMSNFFGTQIELMQSGEVRSRAASRVAAEHPEIKPVRVALSVGQQPKTSIFILRAVGSDATYTRLFLDACLEEFSAIKREMRSEKSETTLTAISDELVSTEKELKQGEDELLAFQQEYNIGYLKEEGNSAGVYLTSLNRQLADLKTEYKLLGLLDLDQNLDRKVTHSTATGDLAADETVLGSGGAAGDYMKARQQLQLMQAERDQYAQFMRPKHPTMVLFDEEIARTKRLIDTFATQSKEQLKSRQDGIGLQIENLETVIAEWETKAVDLSRRIAEYEKIRAKVDRVKAEYERLFSSLRNVDVTKNLDQDILSVLEHASPSVSIKPGLVKGILNGLGGGLALGLAILFFLDRIDDRVSSPRTVQVHLKEAILAQIPDQDHVGPLTPLKHSDARHAFAESFRTLRSSLLFIPVEGERPKSFLVTSSVPNEGKSTVSANLAITMAFAGGRTLLVDGDLRRGSIHEQFGCDNSRGFSDVLRQRIPWRETIVETGIDNLFLLPRGASLPHPSEHLLNPIADRFLREVYAEFDTIIFDSAPALVADDTPSFAPKIDAIIFVLRHDVSSIRLARRALDLLKQRQANVFGLLLNGIDGSLPEYGYYRYKEYYHQQVGAA